MKLKNLIPLREAREEMGPEMMAIPFFREFQTTHGYKPIFRFIGTKGDEHIFTAPITDVGQLDLFITEAQIMAKVTEKEALFGVIYTCTGLERCDAPICKMKLKDNKVEHIAYDSKDKKNFDAKSIKFIGVIDENK